VRFYKTILLLVIFFGAVLLVQSQTIKRYNTFSYSVNEGLLQTTIADIAVDKNNFCWLSFPNGIQKFDGNSFTNIPVQPGLPDDKLVLFFKCNNGDLLLSHSLGISKYDIGSNRFVQVYKNVSSVSVPSYFIGEDENIIYFYCANGMITGINNKTFQIVSATKTGLPTYPAGSSYPTRFSDNIINNKTVININYKLYHWNLKQGILLDSSAVVPDMSIYFLHMKNEDEVFYYTYKINNALQLYNFTSKKSNLIKVGGKDDKSISRCIIYPWQNKLLLTFSSRVYETDSTLHELKSELVNFQNQPVAGNLGIAKIAEDNFGNLYLQTVTGGIKKIIRNNYPIKYFGIQKREENSVLALLPDKKQNRVLAGTDGNGLLVFDTLQRLIKHIRTLPGNNLPFAIGSIIKNNNGDYLLFVVSEKKVWLLKSDFSAMIPVPFSTGLAFNKTGIHYFGNSLFQNNREAITQSQGHLYKADLISNTVTEHEFSEAYVMGGLYYKDKIISHGGDELIFMDAVTFKELKRISFKNTGNVRCFVSDASGIIYMGSNKGIFKIDSTGKILQQLTKENGLPDECIYAMVFDKEGQLWCSTNKGIFRLNNDNSILQLVKEDGLQENEFNTNKVSIAEDGEIFFGGVNGVSSFYPLAIGTYEEKVNLLVTNIKINNTDIYEDSAVWNINNISLPHNKNSFAFDFIAMGNSNPDQYVYQYRMKGIDEQWIQSNELQTVRYYLPPGKYIFQVYASRFFDKQAQPMKEITIIINPPFWKTWWFYTGLALLLIAATGFSITRYSKRKYKRKLDNLENEHKIQLERERISRDLHDSIGAYANAVLYNTELLQAEESTVERNELMNDLKFASKDIITSLRETIWALKKEEYTAEECFLRIRNFVQPFNKYYPHINFKVEGETPVMMNLHYTKALNLVRIIQEALSNAIKHSAATSISIFSSIENGKWNLLVKDNGTGFDYTGVYQLQQGNGLNNIKQRAEESGFELVYETVQQKGTTIIISVPIKSNPTGV
jgi:signal transduction histidine kinase